MKINTGDKELLDTETFLALELGETVIAIEDGSSEPLRFVLDFVENKGNKDATLNFNSVDKRTLRATFVNWNSPLGTTLTEPIEVGTYNNRRLFMLFCITKVGQQGELREITFSLYLGKRVQNGDN